MITGLSTHWALAVSVSLSVSEPHSPCTCLMRDLEEDSKHRKLEIMWLSLSLMILCFPSKCPFPSHYPLKHMISF